MDLFNQLKEKITEGAHVAVKKGSEVIESTKINFDKMGKEQDLSKLYKEIGKLAYDSYKNKSPVEDELLEKFSKVDELILEIDSLKAKLGVIKNEVKCPSCSEIANKDDRFCTKCGYQLKEDF